MAEFSSHHTILKFAGYTGSIQSKFHQEGGLHLPGTEIEHHLAAGRPVGEHHLLGGVIPVTLGTAPMQLSQVQGHKG